MKNWPFLLIGIILVIVLIGIFIVLRPATPADESPVAEAPPPTKAVTVDQTPTVILATPTPLPAPPTPTPTELPAQPEDSELPPIFETEMVLVPGGEFTIGADGGNPDYGPGRVINLPTFEIDKFEVTNDAFAQFVADTGYVTFAERELNQNWQDYATNKGNHPVVKVTWNDAVAYCAWAGKRLPTEEEWEKAARGSDGRVYPWGSEFDAAMANVKATGLGGTAAVGSFPGDSPYGAKDMAGNVWEWTDSWFKAYPGSTSTNQYFGERFRVTRGGARFEEGDQVTTYNRNAGLPDITANDDVGFRCVRDVG